MNIQFGFFMAVAAAAVTASASQSALNGQLESCARTPICRRLNSDREVPIDVTDQCLMSYGAPGKKYVNERCCHDECWLRIITYVNYQPKPKPRMLRA